MSHFCQIRKQEIVTLHKAASARGIFDVGEKDDLVCFGISKSRKPCYRVAWATERVRSIGAWKNALKQAEIR